MTLPVPSQAKYSSEEMSVTKLHIPGKCSQCVRTVDPVEEKHVK